MVPDRRGDRLAERGDAEGAEKSRKSVGSLCAFLRASALNRAEFEAKTQRHGEQSSDLSPRSSAPSASPRLNGPGSSGLLQRVQHIDGRLGPGSVARIHVVPELADRAIRGKPGAPRPRSPLGSRDPICFHRRTGDQKLRKGGKFPAVGSRCASIASTPAAIYSHFLVRDA